MKLLRWWTVGGLCALLLTSWTQSVFAAKRKAIKEVVIKEVTRVEGKIQKPEVWYLLPRSNLNFQGLKLEQKLVPKIEESIKKAPF